MGRVKAELGQRVYLDTNIDFAHSSDVLLAFEFPACFFIVMCADAIAIG